MKHSNFKIILLPLLSINLFAQDLEYVRFKEKVDALSKKISISVRSDLHNKNNDAAREFDERDYCITFSSSGKEYAFNFHGKSTRNESKLKISEIQSFNYAKFQLSIGGTEVFTRNIFKSTVSVQNQITSNLVEINELMAKKNLTVNERKTVEKLTKDNIELNALQYDERIFGDNRLSFRMVDPVPPTSTNSRTLVVKGKDYQGENPSGELKLHYSMERSWLLEQRRLLKNALDLVSIGLVDDQKIKLARVSFLGLPIDAWLPHSQPDGKKLIMPTFNSVIPGWKGGPDSVTIGKQKLMPEIEPSRCRSLKTNSMLDTFLTEAHNPNQINIRSEFERSNSLEFVLPMGTTEENILPIAALDNENRIYVMAWYLLPAYNGVICMVQYEDEEEPRFAYMDPSGVIVRIKKALIEFGLLREKTKNDQIDSKGKLAWADNGVERKKEKLTFVPEMDMHFMKSHSACDHSFDEDAIKHQKEYVLPRSLW
ncbi:MAG: hypothetical protein U0P81_11015 [Holophagaceae bacterium]